MLILIINHVLDKTLKKLPTVITKEELIRINNSDSENSGPRSYTNRLRASNLKVHNKDPDLFYICPKYFDIKKRLSLNPQKVEDEDGKLKEEYSNNKNILRRDNSKNWENIPFNKYQTDILRSPKLNFDAVCCGKKIILILNLIII